MQAYVYRRYGGPEVLELVEMEKPVPRPGEVLVKTLATTVTSGDWRSRSLIVPRGFGLLARPAFGLFGPRQKILGMEFSGVIEAVGDGVTRFRAGDEVFGFTGAKMGCYAQYRTLSETGPIAPKPKNLSFEEAATLCFGGTTALHFLRRAKLQPGQKLLVLGASGGVGTALVQLGRHLGAEVTGVTSTPNLDLVTSLGAHHVIDYTRQDFAANGEKYDVIADAVAATSFKHAEASLTASGHYLSIAGGLSDLIFTHGGKIIAGPAPERLEDILELADLATSGVLRPVIDRRYPFSQLRAAHAYVDTGRKRGSVVVSVEH